MVPITSYNYNQWGLYTVTHNWAGPRYTPNDPSMMLPTKPRRLAGFVLAKLLPDLVINGWVSQMLHGAGIFTYIYPKHDPVM